MFENKQSRDKLLVFYTGNSSLEFVLFYYYIRLHQTGKMTEYDRSWSGSRSQQEELAC